MSQEQNKNLSKPKASRKKREKYLDYKNFNEKTKAFKLYLKGKWSFFQAHRRSIIFRFCFYLIGVYLFGFAVSLYVDLNLGVVNEDLIVFSLVADIWVKGGDNISEYYSFALMFVYLTFWLVVVALKIIKLTQYHYKKILTLTMIYDEIIIIFLDLIPVFLWPAAVELNVKIINPAEHIKPLDPTNITGAEARWNEWLRSWILWASYIIFCLGIGIMVWTKMLQGPYNGLSAELAKITKIPYSLCRVIVDAILLILGLILLFTDYYAINDRLNHLYNWVSYATILMAFFAGPVIGALVTFMNNYIKLELIDIDQKLYKKLKREVLVQFKKDNPLKRKGKMKWRVMQEEILERYNGLIKESFIEEHDDAIIIDTPIK